MLASNQLTRGFDGRNPDAVQHTAPTKVRATKNSKNSLLYHLSLLCQMPRPSNTDIDRLRPDIEALYDASQSSQQILASVLSKHVNISLPTRRLRAWGKMEGDTRKRKLVDQADVLLHGRIRELFYYYEYPDERILAKLQKEGFPIQSLFVLQDIRRNLGILRCRSSVEHEAQMEQYEADPRSLMDSGELLSYGYKSMSEDIAVRHMTRLGIQIYIRSVALYRQSRSCFSNIVAD